MSTMRAIAKLSAGPDDIALVNVPVPEVGDHDVLVRVRAIGVGIHDGYFLPATVRYPYPIGIEGAGTIERLGGKVTTYRVGEEIAFVSAMQPKGGTWAEFAVVSDSSLILRIPPGMTPVEAAAVPVAGNTVLRALHALRLKSEETLFIAGASGAIGTFAIQLAATHGVLVAGSASQRNHSYMRSLGAEKTVDYHDADWIEQIKAWRPGGVDAAMAIQPGTGAACLPVVKDRGRIVLVSGDQVAPERGIRIHQIPHDIDIGPELAHMMTRLARKNLRIEIEQVYRFEDGLEALKKVQTRRARGKIVIEVL